MTRPRPRMRRVHSAPDTPLAARIRQFVAPGGRAGFGGKQEWMSLRGHALMRAWLGECRAQRR